MNAALTRTRPIANRKTLTTGGETCVRRGGEPCKKRTSARKFRSPPTLKRWAYAGVGLTLGLSAWLNGLAFSKHAEVPVHGWVLGLLIPVLILVFSRVGGMMYAAGVKTRAYVAGGACLPMLLLSVQHCAVSIARLTGEPVLLAALMALAIDAGLVVCELATVDEEGK
jgi:hypothetical protein